MNIDYSIFAVGLVLGFCIYGAFVVLCQLYEYLKLKIKKLRQEAAE